MHLSLDIFAKGCIFGLLKNELGLQTHQTNEGVGFRASTVTPNIHLFVACALEMVTGQPEKRGTWFEPGTSKYNPLDIGWFEMLMDRLEPVDQSTGSLFVQTLAVIL